MASALALPTNNTTNMDKPKKLQRRYERLFKKMDLSGWQCKKAEDWYNSEAYIAALKNLQMITLSSFALQVLILLMAMAALCIVIVMRKRGTTHSYTVKHPKEYELDESDESHSLESDSYIQSAMAIQSINVLPRPISLIRSNLDMVSEETVFNKIPTKKDQILGIVEWMAVQLNSYKTQRVTMLFYSNVIDPSLLELFDHLDTIRNTQLITIPFDDVYEIIHNIISLLGENSDYILSIHNNPMLRDEVMSTLLSECCRCLTNSEQENVVLLQYSTYDDSLTKAQRLMELYVRYLDVMETTYKKPPAVITHTRKAETDV